jgi:hypothetical protein
LFSNSPLKNGDILFANSEKNLSKGSIFLQTDKIKISMKSGENFDKLSERAVRVIMLNSIFNSGKFNLLLPESDLEKVKLDKMNLEPAGHFKINEISNSLIKPQIKLSSELLIFPAEIKSEEEKTISVGQYFIINSADDNKQLVRKGKKQDLLLKGEKNSDKVQVGLSEKDFPKHYLQMLKSLSETLSNIVFEELQNQIK